MRLKNDLRDANLQLDEAKQIIPGILAAWEDGYLCDGEGKDDCKCAVHHARRFMVGVLAAVAQKPKCVHDWHADTSRGPGSFCRNCNEVWLPAEKPVEDRCSCGIRVGGSEKLIPHAKDCNERATEKRVEAPPLFSSGCLCDSQDEPVAPCPLHPKQGLV